MKKDETKIFYSLAWINLYLSVCFGSDRKWSDKEMRNNNERNKLNFDLWPQNDVDKFGCCAVKRPKTNRWKSDKKWSNVSTSLEVEIDWSTDIFHVKVCTNRPSSTVKRKETHFTADKATEQTSSVFLPFLCNEFNIQKWRRYLRQRKIFQTNINLECNPSYNTKTFLRNQNGFVSIIIRLLFYRSLGAFCNSEISIFW